MNAITAKTAQPIAMKIGMYMYFFTESNIGPSSNRIISVILRKIKIYIYIIEMTMNDDNLSEMTIFFSY